jgi:hypothetical protein
MQDAKWLFAQQKATLQTHQKVYVYSENALVVPNVLLNDMGFSPCGDCFYDS